MQVCDHCGACREATWRVCPFCRNELETASVVQNAEGTGFDALAALSDFADSEPRPAAAGIDEPHQVHTEAAPAFPDETTFPDDGALLDETAFPDRTALRDDTGFPDETAADDLLTEADLAHLTGAAGPVVNDWASPTETSADLGGTDDDSDGVSRAVVIPLIAAAVVAVVFVAYSIVTQSPPQRPDAVALVDRTTTTSAPIVSTTEAPPPLDGAIPIGVDIAEQAERMCRGDQFSIARSGEPRIGFYNDVMIAVQDGRAEWSASPDQKMLQGPVPPLIGCLRTADAGEIDRCPNSASIISRRAVSWSYRVLRTTDAVEVGSSSGTATDVRPCDELEIEAAGSDYGSWSPLPHDQFDATAPDHTTAPHPQEACTTHLTRTPPPVEEAEPEAPTEPEPDAGPGLALHASAYVTPASDHPLPVGWSAAGDRPVEAVLCLIPTSALDRIVIDHHGDEPAPSDAERPSGPPATDVEPPVQAPPTGCPITVTAMSSSDQWLGSWEYNAAVCPADGEPLVPEAWLVEVVGPALGYPVDDGESTDGDPTDGE